MNFLRKLLVALIAGGLTLGAAEVGLRIFKLYPPPGVGPQIEMTEYGWRLIPNQTSFFRDLHGEFSLYLTSNSWGMHDDEVPLTKPAGARRVAFFGDSYTEAEQVEIPQNFVKGFERVYRQNSGETVQSLNFGMSGYGPDLCYLRYLHQGRQAMPDVVVLVDLVENDAHDVTRDAYPDWYKPFYDLTTDTWIPREAIPEGQTFGRDERSHRWYRKMHLYTLKREATVRWRAWFHERFGKIGKTPLPFHWHMLYVPPNEFWMKAWNTTERVIQRFKDEVERDGRQFVIVIMPSRFEIHPEYWETIKKQHAIEGTVDLEFPRRQIMDIAARLKIKTIDLYPAMKEAGKMERLYLRRDGHLTVAGHKVVAEEISRQMALLFPA